MSHCKKILSNIQTHWKIESNDRPIVFQAKLFHLPFGTGNLICIPECGKHVRKGEWKMHNGSIKERQAAFSRYVIPNMLKSKTT